MTHDAELTLTTWPIAFWRCEVETAALALHCTLDSEPFLQREI